MRYLDAISSNAMELVYELTSNPLLCAILVSIFGSTTLFTIRSIISRLNEMHKSKSSLKKINKTYAFWKKMILLPAWHHCLHAIKFCRFLICYYHIRYFFLMISILLTVTIPMNFSVSDFNTIFAIATILLLDIPVIVLHFVLERYPFRRLKHEYRFEKYNHTAERSKLL